MESDDSESIQEPRRRKMPLEEESSLNFSLKASMNAVLQTVDKSARQMVKEPLEIVAHCCMGDKGLSEMLQSTPAAVTTKTRKRQKQNKRGQKKKCKREAAKPFQGRAGTSNDQDGRRPALCCKQNKMSQSHSEKSGRTAETTVKHQRQCVLLIG
jgi:hypothetical protein